MPVFGINFSLEHKPWNQPWCWCVLAVLALAAHYALGWFIIFPFLFIFPIMLSAWYSGRSFSLALTAILCLIRFSFIFNLPAPWTLGDAALNGFVRFLVLALIALLTAHMGKLHRALQLRVKTLEGLLPICAFCKRIRDERGEWNGIETYITSHSAAQFTHSYCPECIKQNYAEYLEKNGNG